MFYQYVHHNAKSFILSWKELIQEDYDEIRRYDK